MIIIITPKSSIEYYYDIINLENKSGHYYIKPKYNLGITYLILNGIPIAADNPIFDIDSYANTVKIYLHELDQEIFITIDNFNILKDISITMDVCYMGSSEHIRVFKMDIKDCVEV